MTGDRGAISAIPKRGPRLLTYEDSVGFLSWPGAMEALRAGHLLPRPHLGDLLLGLPTALLLNRAAHIQGLGCAVKAETVFGGNAARGLPSVQGAVLLFDHGTGAIRAVIESRLVTEYKTAADSVLAAKLLARADSRSLLVVGAGVVATSLVQAYRAGFPDLQTIRVWARRSEQARALVAAVDDPGLDIAVTTDLQRAAADADIVSTATMAREPVLRGAWIAPGTHVDLIGGFTPEMREADDELISMARLFVDCRETTIEVVGDLTKPMATSAITREHVLGDLYDMVGPKWVGRTSDADVTVFKNGGGAHLDLMVADYIAGVVGQDV